MTRNLLIPPDNLQVARQGQKTAQGSRGTVAGNRTLPRGKFVQDGQEFSETPVGYFLKDFLPLPCRLGGTFPILGEPKRRVFFLKPIPVSRPQAADQQAVEFLKSGVFR